MFLHKNSAQSSYGRAGIKPIDSRILDIISLLLEVLFFFMQYSDGNVKKKPYQASIYHEV